jgi:hypothetical protein
MIAMSIETKYANEAQMLINNDSGEVYIKFVLRKPSSEMTENITENSTLETEVIEQATLILSEHFAREFIANSGKALFGDKFVIKAEDS